MKSGDHERAAAGLAVDARDPGGLGGEKFGLSSAGEIGGGAARDGLPVASHFGHSSFPQTMRLKARF